jgi:hypothetical protein
VATSRTSSPAVNALAATADFEFSALDHAANYRSALVQTFRPYLRGNVVEVGAGIGQFSGELLKVPEISRLLAVEPDERFFPRLQQKLGSARCLKGTANHVPQTGWDCIVSVNVLEHIEDDAAELVTYRKLLAETVGSLCLFVPARPEIYAPLDRDFGHFRRYRRKELGGLLQRAGFQVEYLYYFNFAGYFAWWTSFKLLGQRGFKTSAVRLYDRWIFPSIFWAETHLARPPLGQSLVAIARPRG